LLSHDKGNTFKTIIATIDELGYDCKWQVLNSKNQGVPQNRERIIIVGHLRGTPRPQVFPIGDCIKPNIKIWLKNENFSRDLPNSTYRNESKSKRPNIRRLTPTECERLQAFPDDWTKYGKDGELISDSQRYKMCGNAVTTNVIRDVFMKIFKKGDL
jgi:site-specific DNA-cytosine methylase